jgi:NADH-quinone oxidoreductase subunit A
MTSSPTLIVAYLTLFAVVGFATIFVALMLGWFLRAKNRTPEKLEIYECGEPPVGSGFAQFDLRFYVVALLFIIFDVEVAFFFPWATVFGKATQLRNPQLQSVSNAELSPAQQKLAELGVPESAIDASSPTLSEDPTGVTADRLALAAMIDIGIFFAVLMVGFAYVWHRGDLDWVRAVRAVPAERGPPAETA